MKKFSLPKWVVLVSSNVLGTKYYAILLTWSIIDKRFSHGLVRPWSKVINSYSHVSMGSNISIQNSAKIFGTTRVIYITAEIQLCSTQLQFEFYFWFFIFLYGEVPYPKYYIILETSGKIQFNEDYHKYHDHHQESQDDGWCPPSMCIHCQHITIFIWSVITWKIGIIGTHLNR